MMSETEKPILEIFELVDYVDDGSRSLEEGSKVLNSNYILLCGFSSTERDEDKYFALCLQCSSQTSYPHEINVALRVENNKKVIKAHCSCTAGSLGQCKHITGVLLYLNKHTKSSIEQLGSTDLRQQWGQIKQKVGDALKAEPFKDFCHGAQVEYNIAKSAETKRAIFKVLCEADEDSELSHHTKSYRSSLKLTDGNTANNNNTTQRHGISQRALQVISNSHLNSTPVICNLNSVFGVKRKRLEGEYPKIVERMVSNSIWDPYLKDFSVKIETREQARFYNQNVHVTPDKAKTLMIETMKQSNKLWLDERKKRITGSICYALYTYMKNNHTPNEWDKKLVMTFQSTFKGNQHTFRGKELESVARKAYEREMKCKVEEFGLMVQPTNSWFGFSMDGLAEISGDFILIEIKCPKNDDNLTAQDLAKKQKYIEELNGKLFLKQSHPYYGQVQLGMCLCKLEKCHFIIYESSHGSCAIIEVKRNDIFLSDMMPKLSDCYFTYILPWLTKINSQNN